MKIGIITIQKCGNFGADLQAYALVTKLRMMGYDAENIDYLFYKNPNHVSNGVLEKPVLPISFVNRVKELLYPLMKRTKTYPEFGAWFDKNVPCGKEYRSVKELYDDPPKYDVYVVGSDQVWNPRMYSNITPYFLGFAPNDSLCISYASSFGVSELTGCVFYKYKQWLKRFSSIGVREKSAVGIVNAMGLSSEIEQVIDPTLLLTTEEWSKVSNPTTNRDYLLLYDLIICKDTVKVARELALDMGIKIVRIGDGMYNPGDFLGLFSGASAVVTNSFHGTVFSILNHKPFVVVIPKRMKNSGRIYSLLDSIGLGYDNRNIGNWEFVDKKISNLRKESLDYLERALGGRSRLVNRRIPLECYALINKNELVRRESTSGGVFSMIASAIISRGGVVYGAVFSKDFKSVKHVATESNEGLSQMRKSKYVWSDPTDAYKSATEMVRKGKLVLFSGTPCQCSVIRKLCSNADNLLTIDFACHGTPNADYFSSYIDDLEQRYKGRVVSYEFRNKDKGWNFPRVVAIFSNGKRYIRILRNDPYYLCFALNISLRSACYSCPYIGIERQSDFTIADCWRVATTNPEIDDNKGTSLVLVNSEKGRMLFNSISIDDFMLIPYDLDLAQMRNQPFMQCAQKSSFSETFTKSFSRDHSFSNAAKMVISRKMYLKATLYYWIKRFGWFYFKMHQ